MEDKLKFYLLAEESGWDCSTYAYEYSKKLTNSKAYKVLTVNILSMRNILGDKPKEIVDAFDNLDFEPRTLKDVFVVENTLNYLALHSFPEFYLNPLSINPNYSGDVSSIGDLMFNIYGKEMPLNEIITNDEIPLDIKKEEINDQLDYYLNDMNKLVVYSMQTLKRRAFASKDDRKDLPFIFLEAFGFSAINFLLLFFFTYPNLWFRECLYVMDPSKSLTYLGILSPLLVFFYDFTFIFFHAYKSRISEPYNYARRFTRENTESIFKDIKQRKEELFDYICGAINNKITLSNDIKDFSKLSSSYIDFDKVLNVEKLKKKKGYIVLHSLVFVSATLAATVMLVTLIIYLISLSLKAAI